MKNLLFSLIYFASHLAYTIPVNANYLPSQTEVYFHLLEKEAQTAFEYFYNEVEQDPFLTHEEQFQKIQEFKNFTNNLTPEVAARLTTLLLQETRSRILDMLHHSDLDDAEIQAHLEDNGRAILNVQNMDVETAWQMLFFVAELKLHRQYVYDFGIALGCPERQLLQHDLSKLSENQFEGYSRYFRGGKLDKDKAGFLAAWEYHQLEEHHLESYRRNGYNFDSFTEEHLRLNMLETVADWSAAAKQRGGGTLVDFLINGFAKKQTHPLLLDYLEEALHKAHALYVDSEKNPEVDSIFKGFPYWNDDVEQAFQNLKNN